MLSNKAQLGKWYKDSEENYFEIVAIDNDEGLIEMQSFDGTVAEVDQDAWRLLGAEKCAPPEDWSGPFDDLEQDDFGDTEKIRHPATPYEEEIDHME